MNNVSHEVIVSKIESMGFTKSDFRTFSLESKKFTNDGFQYLQTELYEENVNCLDALPKKDRKYYLVGITTSVDHIRVWSHQ